MNVGDKVLWYPGASSMQHCTDGYCIGRVQTIFYDRCDVKLHAVCGWHFNRETFQVALPCSDWFNLSDHGAV